VLHLAAAVSAAAVSAAAVSAAAVSAAAVSAAAGAGAGAGGDAAADAAFSLDEMDRSASAPTLRYTSLRVVLLLQRHPMVTLLLEMRRRHPTAPPYLSPEVDSTPLQVPPPELDSTSYSPLVMQKGWVSAGSPVA